MDKNLYNKKVGTYILKLRKDKNLKQIELDKKSNVSYKTIGRIEKGEITPHVDNLVAILNALGKSYEDFLNEVLGEEKVIFDNKFSIIWDYGYKKDYDTAYRLLQDLQKEDFYDKENIYFKQQLLLLEGILTCYLISQEQGLVTLIEAIKLTRNNIFIKIDEKELLNTEKIKNTVFNKAEYRIIREIAATYGILNELETAISINIAVLSSLENPLVSIEMKNRISTTIYYNILFFYAEIKDYTKAIYYGELGVEFCKNIGTTKNLADLYKKLSEVYRLTDIIEKSVEYYNLHKFIMIKVYNKNAIITTDTLFRFYK